VPTDAGASSGEATKFARRGAPRDGRKSGHDQALSETAWIIPV